MKTLAIRYIREIRSCWNAGDELQDSVWKWVGKIIALGMCSIPFLLMIVAMAIVQKCIEHPIYLAYGLIILSIPALTLYVIVRTDRKD